MKLKLTILVLVLPFALFGYDYLPIQIDSGRWAMLDLNGKIHYSNRFERIYSNVYESAFYAKEPGKTDAVYVITNKGLVKIASNVEHAGIFNGGLMPIVHPNGPIEVINKQGRRVFRLDSVNGERVDHCECSFHFGFLHFITTKGSQGLVNAKGKVVLFGPDDVGLMNQNLLLARVGKCLLAYDAEGKYLKTIPYYRYNLCLMHSGFQIPAQLPQSRMLVTDSADKKLLRILIDSKADVITDTFPYFGYQEGFDGLILCEREGGEGVLNRNLEVVVPVKYQFVQIGKQGIFARRTSNAPYEYITYDGKNHGTEWCRMTGFIGQNDIDLKGSFLVLTDGRHQDERPRLTYIFNPQMKLIYKGMLYEHVSDLNHLYVHVTSETVKRNW